MVEPRDRVHFHSDNQLSTEIKSRPAAELWQGQTFVICLTFLNFRVCFLIREWPFS